jgi:hypothetical protein
MMFVTALVAALIAALWEGYEGAGRSAPRGGQGTSVFCPDTANAASKTVNREGRIWGRMIVNKRVLADSRAV